MFIAGTLLTLYPTKQLSEGTAYKANTLTNIWGVRPFIKDDLSLYDERRLFKTLLFFSDSFWQTYRPFNFTYFTLSTHRSPLVFLKELREILNIFSKLKIYWYNPRWFLSIFLIILIQTRMIFSFEFYGCRQLGCRDVTGISYCLRRNLFIGQPCDVINLKLKLTCICKQINKTMKIAYDFSPQILNLRNIVNIF